VDGYIATIRGRERRAALKWTIVATAKFYRRLPSPISVLGVIIESSGDPPDSRVNLTVDATTSEQEASANAKALCEKVSGITRLALSSQLSPRRGTGLTDGRKTPDKTGRPEQLRSASFVHRS
jgi:hypothetical protein